MKQRKQGGTVGLQWRGDLQPIMVDSDKYGWPGLHRVRRGIGWIGEYLGGAPIAIAISPLRITWERVCERLGADFVLYL